MADVVETGAGAIRLAERSGRWVLLATVLGSSMAMLDGTVVNIALPTIGKSLGASLAGLQWTVNAYTLTLAGLILLGGSLGDRLGRRRVFVTGVVWFALSSALCGLAPNIGVLIGARALQGVGGALLTPGSLAIIQATYVQQDRPRAVGAWSGLGGVAGAIGPFLGGWIIGTAGWRWIFLINLPLAAVVIAVTTRHVPESRDPSAHGRFDVLGAALAALALGGITYALIAASGNGPVGGGVVAAAVVGVVAGAAFVLVERARSRSPEHVPPMLPLDVFASRQFTAVNLVTFVVYGALGGMLFLLVLELQVVSGYSPLQAGVALLPFTLLMLLLSARAGALAARVGPRWLMTSGSLTCAVGMLLMTRIGPHASYVLDVLPAVFVFGLGLSIVVAPLTATVLASADVRHAGVASGVNNAVARAAGLLAVAGLPLAVGLTGPDYLRPAVFEGGFRMAMVICAALLVLGAILSATMINDDVLRPARPGAPVPECRTCFPVGSPPLEPGVPAPALGPAPG
ncbi:MAG TPA: MFS transporter [Streptosporangiaceae bacterium]|nr:MFS transporter [Streptosporangiaceae bacterium]